MAWTTQTIRSIGQLQRRSIILSSRHYNALRCTQATPALLFALTDMLIQLSTFGSSVYTPSKPSTAVFQTCETDANE